MSKFASTVLGIAAAVLIGSIITSFSTSAQNNADQYHGVPTSEKAVGDGKPVPLKLETRVYDSKRLLSGPALSENGQIGRALWLQKCAFCHDGVGQPTYKTMGPWLGAETVEALGEESMKIIIANGTARMPAFRYNLQPQQVDDLIAFLKTVTSDQKPTPVQLAGGRGSQGAPTEPSAGE